MPKKADNVPARLPLDVFAAEQVRFRAFRLNKVFKPLGEKGRGRALSVDQEVTIGGVDLWGPLLLAKAWMPENTIPKVLKHPDKGLQGFRPKGPQLLQRCADNASRIKGAAPVTSGVHGDARTHARWAAAYFLCTSLMVI